VKENQYNGVNRLRDVKAGKNKKKVYEDEAEDGTLTTSQNDGRKTPTSILS